MSESAGPFYCWNIFNLIKPFELQGMIIMLKSPIEDDRRRSVQSFVNLKDSPIQHIECWPDMKCTALQLFVAEMMILEWLKHLRRNPTATEAEVIDGLFPPEEDFVPGPEPRVRKLAKPFPEEHQATPNPPKPSKFSIALDRLNDVVKESILDFSIGPEPNEFATPPELDVSLRPFDCKAFDEQMRPHVSDALEVAAEILAKPATDRDLAAASEELGKVTDALRWTALEIAMDLRTQPTASSQGERRDAELVSVPSEPHSWAKKFRRMRAAGF
jgi:hypothetical protein